MGDSFEIFPGNDCTPTINEFVELVIARRNEFLLSQNIPPCSELAVHFISHGQVLPHGHTTKLLCNDDEWINFSGLYCSNHKMNETDFEILRADSEAPGCGPVAAAIFKKSMSVGQYWSFQRSAGHPSINYLTHGFLAGALAEMTNGLVTSTDAAWACYPLPMTAEDFYKVHFRAEYCTDRNRREWFLFNIDAIRLAADNRVSAKTKEALHQDLYANYLRCIGHDVHVVNKKKWIVDGSEWNWAYPSLGIRLRRWLRSKFVL